ncbi:MAG: methyltransferase [Syntrophus sp. (in: bacteria)]
MEAFDPFGWLEKYLPARIIHLSIRMVIIAVLIAFLTRCVYSYGLYPFKPLWFVETLTFIAFLVSYFIRKDPVNRSSGAKEIIVPLIGGILPFALLISPPNLFIAGNPLALQAIFYWMTAATTLTVWGLWTLKSSFSITVEARDLVTSGPYHWIRHPIYSGEILAALAVTAWRFSMLNIFIITLFVVIQLLRAKWEEDKLAMVFPGYSIYAAKTSWPFPHNKQ